jgi:stearoyl-CoA desaturase (delta-9 desaturase)
VSTVLLWHGTFTINSLSHMFGRRRYATDDNSRNSAILAVVTLGEGWHNNHHHYQRSTRQGFFWWEWDPTYYVLVAMKTLGLVWDLHEPPAKLLLSGDGGRRDHANVLGRVAGEAARPQARFGGNA